MRGTALFNPGDCMTRFHNQWLALFLLLLATLDDTSHAYIAARPLTVSSRSSTTADQTPRINPDLLTSLWTASWIAVPNTSPFDYGVYHFRKVFELSSKPGAFVVHVTADNRYQLFVNGERVSWGPARGDLNHWRYETVDLAPQLKPGKNVLAAVVWNF